MPLILARAINHFFAYTLDPPRLSTGKTGFIARWVAGWLSLLLIEIGYCQVQLDPQAFLLLEATLDGTPLATEIIGYQYEDTAYLALRDVVDALDFPINVDAEQGIAGGWFISEARSFEVNIPQRQVILGDARQSLAADSAVVFENELYAKAEALQAWFPLEVELNIRQLRVEFIPQEPLPIQARMARRQRQVAGGRRDYAEPQLPPLKNPRSILGERSFNARATLSTVRSAQDAAADRRLTYSTLSRGDLAWMDSSLFLGGNARIAGRGDSDYLNQARLNLSRSRMTSAPLAIHHVEVGDLLSGGGGDRGILVRGGAINRTVYGQYEFDSILLQGEKLPGWDVELYHNGTLIRFQTIGEDGRFEFPDVQLYLGENRFEYIFYGPAGEEEHERFVHYVGPGMLGSGKLNYQVAVSQINRSVFNLAESGSGEADGELRINSNASLGLTQWLSANANIQSMPSGGKRIQTYRGGLRASLGAVSTSLNYNHTPIGQDSINTLVQTHFWDTRLRLGHTHFLAVGLEASERPDDARQFRSTFGINASPFDVPITFNISHEESQRSQRTVADLGVTARFGQYRLNNSLSGNRSAAVGDDSVFVERSLRGSVGLYTRLRLWTFRTSTSYVLIPERAINSVSMTADLNVARDLSMNFRTTRSLQSARTQYSSALNWRFEELMLSPRILYGSEERFSGILSVSFSFAHQPRRWGFELDRASLTGTGHVASRVFVDQDNDGEYDAEDEPLPEVRVYAVQVRREALTGKDGQAFVTRLPAYRPTDISVDVVTLPDINLTPTQPGHSITPRPGDWVKLDFPVIRTGSLEGYVRIRPDEGQERKGLSRVLVKLVEQDTQAMIARQRSAFDGYFYFDGVPPGNYRLVLDNIAQSRILKSPQTPIEVRSDGGMLAVRDFVLKPTAKQDKPTGFAPRSAAAKAADKDAASTKEQAPATRAETQPPVPPQGFGLQEAAEPMAFPLPPAAEAEPPATEPAPEDTDTTAAAAQETDAESSAAKSDKQATPAQPAPSEPAPPAATGDWYLQFGAFSSRNNAANGAASLRSTLGSQLSQLTINVRQSGGLYRIVTTPNVSEARAQELCRTLTQQGVSCLVKAAP